jgi:RND family efflux transporter MFP subunit
MSFLFRTTIISLMIVAALFLAGCRRAAPPDENAPQAPVKAAEAESVELAEWIDLIGSTQPLPDQTARITAIVPGRVVGVLQGEKGKALVEGQHVGRDDVIVQLDDRIARAQLEEIEELKNQAELAQKLAKLDLDRLEKLYPVNTDPRSIPLVSKIEIEQATLKLKDAESKQRGAQARKKSLAVELEHYKLCSPISGTLGTLQIAPGQTLSAGTTVAEVVNLDVIDVVAFASPHLAAKLDLGQNAKLRGRNQSESDQDSFEGTITYIAKQAQSETGNFLVKARFTNKNQRHRANQVVRLDVEIQKKKSRLVIAESVLMEDHDPPYVVIAQEVETKKNNDGGEEKLGKARKVFAYLGVRDRERGTVEILRLEDPQTKEAIPVGKTLFILEGGLGLHDGDQMRIEKAKNP